MNYLWEDKLSIACTKTLRNIVRILFRQHSALFLQGLLFFTNLQNVKLWKGFCSKLKFQHSLLGTNRVFFN